MRMRVLSRWIFWGCATLPSSRNACGLIRQNHGGLFVNGVETDIDDIPLDDPKTFELFQRGETNAIFQFESDGMKKHMKDLKPDRFEDLIAMNALYRPGPIAVYSELHQPQTRARRS